MDRFEINKIIAAIILTVVIVFGIGKISDIIYNTESTKVASYKVDSNNNTQTNQVKSESTTDIKALLALGSADKGKKVFNKCAACHSITEGGGNKIGPALYSILGREMASVNNFKYSKALSQFGKSWGFDEMNAFLTKPAKYIKGTKMAFAGLKNDEDRASVILYMNQQAKNPLPLP